MNADTITLAVGAFRDPNQAQGAAEELRQAGFRDNQIGLIERQEKTLAGEIRAVLTGLGLSNPEAGYYQNACDAGHILVVVEAEGRFREAQDILERNGSGDAYGGEVWPEDEGPHLVSGEW